MPDEALKTYDASLLSVKKLLNKQIMLTDVLIILTTPELTII